jgi:transcriptional regulator with XRE-family HTH domain
MKTFGQILREKRKELGWKQKDLADKLNTYPSTISAWETDRGVPSVYTAIDLADVFGCSLDELVGRGSQK